MADRTQGRIGKIQATLKQYSQPLGWIKDDDHVRLWKLRKRRGGKLMMRAVNSRWHRGLSDNAGSSLRFNLVPFSEPTDFFAQADGQPRAGLNNLGLYTSSALQQE